jgi:hypothetical protein
MKRKRQNFGKSIYDIIPKNYLTSLHLCSKRHCKNSDTAPPLKTAQSTVLKN